MFPCAAELGDTVVHKEGLKGWGETRPFAWFCLGGKAAGGGACGLRSQCGPFYGVAALVEKGFCEVEAGA